MQEIKFFKFVVTNQVFYKSKYTYALVNLKPLVPGHVLIVPLRNNTPRLSDLTPEESVDYFQVVQLIQRFIKDFHKADGLNIAMQDGPALGQSVPHVHTHIIPRYSIDGFGDEIYAKIENLDLEKYYEDFAKEKESFRGNLGAFKKEIPEDHERVERTHKVMEEEATLLREGLQEYIKTLDKSKVIIPE